MKIKISKAQWLRIGQAAGWSLPEDVDAIRAKRFYDEDTQHPELARKREEHQRQHKQRSDIIRNHEIINPPTRGKMHRCKFCWTEVDKTDNGFKPFEQPYPHSNDCPYKEAF